MKALDEVSNRTTDHDELTWLVFTLLIALLLLGINFVALHGEPAFNNFVGLLLSATWAVLLFRGSERSFRASASKEGWALTFMVLLFCGITAVFLWRYIDSVQPSQ